MSVPTPPGLECLLDLACRDGVDIRPTLLRVLTDLYVQRPSHSAEEEHHYVELAQRLLQTVDTKTREAVSARLREYQRVPPPLLAYLTPQPAAAGMPAAAPTKVTPAPQQAVAPAPQQRPPADADARAPDARLELCESFFAASPAERRLILLNLDAVAEADAQTQLAATPATANALEIAALRRDRTGFAREIVRLMRVDTRMALRIVDDATGEPLIIPARLADMPENVLQRVLLFLNPTVGRSVQRVFELSALYAQFTLPAARHMAAILRTAAETPAGTQQSARYDAALWPQTDARLRSTARSHPARAPRISPETSPEFTPLPLPPFRIGSR